MTAQPLDPPTLPVCHPCAAGEHHMCHLSVPTGRTTPDTDPYRERTRMLAVYVACACPCGGAT